MPALPLALCLPSFCLKLYPGKKKIRSEDILGLQIVRGVKELNHDLFADDSLLLGAASVHAANQFKLVVDEFCIASGSRLNVGKCHFYG
jgi:hypothetical protein